MQGEKIYKVTQLTHKKIFTKYLIKKFFRIFLEVFDLINLFLSKLLSIFSGEISVKVYEKINKLKTKILRIIK